MPPSRPSIVNSQSVFKILKDQFHPLQEEVWVLGLNSQLEIMSCDLIFRGTADACLVHPRDLFRSLIVSNSTRFILSHNHPSGSSEPSERDLELTRRICKTGLLMEIPMIDHIIVGAESYFSFGDSGLLSGKRVLGRSPYRYQRRV